MTSKNESAEKDALITEMAALRIAVSNVTTRMNLPMSRMLTRSLLRGLAFGLGSVLGATLVVSFLIYSLASIDFIPIVGEWAREISDMIKKP